MNTSTESNDVLSQIRAQHPTVILTKGAKFSTGSIVATPAALKLLQKHGFIAAQLLARHIAGDWGDCYKEDVELNIAALQDGSRLFSVYRLVSDDVMKDLPQSKRSNLPTIWIITESKNEFGVRHVTTLLCPEDY